ncbi:hypothetical protein MKW92_038431 [Papaver armeniacum]|nr:hypothetical protein MKW92_038431 [Papaver armeniacum]
MVEVEEICRNLSGELIDPEVYTNLYSSLYTGRCKLNRLLFMAENCDNQEMRLEALRVAYDESKNGLDTELFKEIVQKIDNQLGSEYCLDLDWVESVDRDADIKKEKLENELNACSVTTMNESIRMRFKDFADFYYSRGHLCDAFKYYARCLHHSTSSDCILQSFLNVILVCTEMGQFSHVENYVSKAEQTGESLDPVTIAKLCCASGLAHLESRKYKLAACKFLETGSELGNTYKEVISPRDVAVYGGLCALASFDTSELEARIIPFSKICTFFDILFHNKVIDNGNFQIFLGLAPDMRRIINYFCSRNYALCIEHLLYLRPKILLDIHLYDHVETLYGHIRHKSLLQYTLQSGYIDLEMMAHVFGTDVPELEKELVPVVTNYQSQKLDHPSSTVKNSPQHPLKELY